MNKLNIFPPISFDSKKIFTSFGSSFLLSLTLFFFGPSLLYYSNILEIPFLYSNFFLAFLINAIIVGVIIGCILLFLQGKNHQYGVILVFICGLLFWIQGNIIVWDYGLLDGREIIWSNYILNGIIDTIIWISFIGIAFIKRDILFQHISFICAVLIVIQTGSLVFDIMGAPDEPDWKISGGGQGYDERTFEFSSNQNVIILILDAFRSDVFQDFINEDDSYQEIFEGFTYYRNAVSGFPHTDASPSLILTGEYYDDSIKLRDHVEKQFLNQSIPLLLKKNGFLVDLYPLIPKSILKSNETASNIGIPSVGGEEEMDMMSGVQGMQQITFFRFVPHFFKSYFYCMPFNGSGKKTPHDLIFYNLLQQNISVQNKTKIFKFYHNTGPHGPLNLNSQLKYEKLRANNKGYREQAYASLKIAGEFLSQLKEKEIYNNSMIFIIGDHGAFKAGHGVNDTINVSSLKEKIQDIPTQTDLHEAAAGTPLILIKSFNQTGNITISDAPVSLSDIPKTIASELGLDNLFAGKSIFSINESDIRTRKFFSYVPGKMRLGEYLKMGYLPPLREYHVNGHSWLEDSWEPTNKKFEPGIGLITKKYQVGTQIDLSYGNYASNFLKGWVKGTSDNSLWTTGHDASVVLDIDMVPENVYLNMNARAYVSKGLPNQTVLISINRYKTAKPITFGKDYEYISLKIPKGSLIQGLNYIKFDLPNATSPQSLGISEDKRLLGINLRSISLDVNPINDT